MMVYRTPSDQKIERFWQWFAENQKEFYQMLKTEPQLVEKKISNRLKSLSRLAVPIVEYDSSSDKAIFTLSAAGIEGMFPAVEAIMKQAPKYDNWILYAFKQPEKVGEDDSIPETDYKVNQIYINVRKNDSGRYIIDAYVVDYEPDNYYKLLSGIFKVINKLLGEYKTVKLIDKVIVNPYDNQRDLYKFTALDSLLSENE